jgi:hypothetical protein
MPFDKFGENAKITDRQDDLITDYKLEITNEEEK